jgi:hypothetical protein
MQGTKEVKGNGREEAVWKKGDGSSGFFESL